MPASAAAYEASEILGLSADEMRRRAMRINPMRTAWIGRVDTIPPQSDERTALIDRGLILRGLLTEGQLVEIHRVGDLWLKHNDAVRLADTVAAKTADESVEAVRRERAERKARRKQEALDRAKARRKAVARRRAEEIDFLGARVSGELADRRSNVERLGERGLPVLSSAGDLARALGVSVPTLRWLSFHSDAAERTHYVYFQVPKRSGGMRLLAAPHRKLGNAQRWVLENILTKLPVEAPAHGFVARRSTLSNAAPHVGKAVVVNLDLSDFFPTITFPRVRGMFKRLGYSPAVATVLALLSTESPRRAVDYDGRRYWVATGMRALPQGACTSPAISNQIAKKLDRRLAGMAAKHGWTYTRYADDLTFSRADSAGEAVATLLARVRHIVGEEGFALNPKKGRIQRPAGRQTVTGIVVNEKPGLPREEVRRLRAILHGAKSTGLAAQNREGIPRFRSWLRGRIAYLTMVDRAKGEALLRELESIAKSAGDNDAPSPYANSTVGIVAKPSLPPETRVIAAASAPPPPQTSSGNARHFEFIGGGSRKFWSIELSGTAHTVHFGRIGTEGQWKTKSFSSVDEAKKDADRLIREKTGKGYVEKT